MTEVIRVDKGWGYELIFASNELYCGKIMKFNKGAKFSMHFHAEKDETWYILEGKFLLKLIKTDNAEVNSMELHKGDTWRNRPLIIHQLICLEEGSIIEVSTQDKSTDNFRVMPGDSQQ